MGKDTPLWKTAIQTLDKGIYVKDTLSRVSSSIKKVMIHITASPAIWVNTAQTGKDPGKLRAVGRPKFHSNAGLEKTIALRHHITPGVYSGPI